MAPCVLSLSLDLSFEVGDVCDSDAGLAIPVVFGGLKIRRIPAALKG